MKLLFWQTQDAREQPYDIRIDEEGRKIKVYPPSKYVEVQYCRRCKKSMSQD